MATQRKGGKGLCCVDGNYRRTIGKHLNRAGKIAPRKFILGRDRQKAEVANWRLEMLWSIVEERHNNAASRMLNVPPEDRNEPIWDGFEYQIAEAVRQHKHTMLVDPDDVGCLDESAFASRIHFMSSQFEHVIRIVPKDPDELVVPA